MLGRHLSGNNAQIFSHRSDPNSEHPTWHGHHKALQMHVLLLNLMHVGLFSSGHPGLHMWQSTCGIAGGIAMQSHLSPDLLLKPFLTPSIHVFNSSL